MFEIVDNRAWFPLSVDELRVVVRALGAFASDYEMGCPEEDKDVRLALYIRERMKRWER